MTSTESTPEPTAGPDPETTPETDPETAPEASAEPTPETAPEIMADADTAPAAVAVADPSPEAAGEPTPEILAEADAAPAAVAVAEPAPEAAVEPPVDAPVTGPTTEPTTGSTTGSTREPEVTSTEWGRVEDDGTVYVVTAEGERVVGQYAAGTPAEGLQFYADRFAMLAFEVETLEKRVAGAKLNPEEAATSVKTLRDQVAGAAAVGDLASLAGRLAALGPVIALQREQRKAERAAKQSEAKEAKEKVVTAAEKVAEGSDWRNGSARLRDLLEEWKVLPRIDKPSDDELWKRFSGARTTYTRRRKAHFAELDGQRDSARVVKERLVVKAESLSSSTEWGPTSGEYRDLMRDWKAAGPAPRDVEDQLWQRFRAAQDTFFGARDAANAAQDQEFAGNAEIKDKLLLEAEALLPIKNLDAAKRTFRDIGERWEAAGKVPRDRIKDLEARIRKVEQALRGAEDDKWRRSDPEKSARANGMVTQLRDAIAAGEAKLEKARAAGDDRRVKDLESELASRRSLLEMAERSSADFIG